MTVFIFRKHQNWVIMFAHCCSSLPTIQQHHETRTLQAAPACSIQPWPWNLPSAHRDDGDWDGMTQWLAPLVITRWFPFGRSRAGNDITIIVCSWNLQGKASTHVFFFSAELVYLCLLNVPYENTILLAIFTLIFKICWFSRSWPFVLFHHCKSHDEHRMAII